MIIDIHNENEAISYVRNLVSKLGNNCSPVFRTLFYKDGTDGTRITTLTEMHGFKHMQQIDAINVPESLLVVCLSKRIIVTCDLYVDVYKKLHYAILDGRIPKLDTLKNKYKSIVLGYIEGKTSNDNLTAIMNLDTGFIDCCPCWMLHTATPGSESIYKNTAYYYTDKRCLNYEFVVITPKNSNNIFAETDWKYFYSNVSDMKDINAKVTTLLYVLLQNLAKSTITVCNITMINMKKYYYPQCIVKVNKNSRSYLARKRVCPNMTPDMFLNIYYEDWTKCEIITDFCDEMAVVKL